MKEYAKPTNLEEAEILIGYDSVRKAYDCVPCEIKECEPIE